MNAFVKQEAKSPVAIFNRIFRVAVFRRIAILVFIGFILLMKILIKGSLEYTQGKFYSKTKNVK